MRLPIEALLPDLLSTLASGNTAVLQAPPGTGKTTRVPLALLGQPWLGSGRIIMLEPRRLAARSAAQFMARQLGEEAGQTVGYRTRIESRVSVATRIEVVTEGILTRLLQSDPELSLYSAVIFDEFHERSLNADLGLALVRDCQQGLREDLRLLVMSATLDAQSVSALLGKAPVLACEAPLFPVETRYAPPGRAHWQDHLVAELLSLWRSEPGSMLVFLPGEGEIRRVAQALEGRLDEQTTVYPLYGALSLQEQDRAMAPCAPGQRKIVLATSIAETSLTIEGVRLVVDSGQMRKSEFDPGSAMTRLVTSRVSAASADQRRGRAGRLGPGVCVRLWSADEHVRLAPFSAPEITQADLGDVVLELAQWGVRDPSGLCWLDQPPAAHWAQARELLQALEALDDDGRITPHGRELLKPGLPPRLAHMLVRGRELGVGTLAAEVAALLSERDVLSRDAGIDLMDRVQALRGEKDFRADRGALARVRDNAKRFRERSGRTSPVFADEHDALGALLVLAYPDRVARRRPGGTGGGPVRYQLANGRGAVVAEDNVLAASEWLVMADLDGQARESRVYLAAQTSRAVIEQVLAADIREKDVLDWDKTTDAVRATRQRCLGQLVLEEKRVDSIRPEQLTVVLLQALRESGLDRLPWTEELRQWQARAQWMHRLEPDAFPAMDDDSLLSDLEVWAAPFMQGVTRFSHLERFPLADALASRLEWSLQQRLEKELPARITVPTGSAIRIDYCAGEVPVLPVKLQEMFGLQETPRLAGGRVPLSIHLLSPAQRPVAVTSDLASFWRNAYADVRRDLRGRYPRHPWPEDPLKAVAQKGVKHPRPRG